MSTELTVAQRTNVNLMSFVNEIGGGLTVAKQVTKSVLRQEDGIPLGVEFETAFREGEILKKGKQDMAPAHIADVIDLATGECCILIGNEVLRNELERHYPDAGYVGKLFAFVRDQARAKDGLDKRYKTYRILELTRNGGAIVSAGEPVIEGKKYKKSA